MSNIVLIAKRQNTTCGEFDFSATTDIHYGADTSHVDANGERGDFDFWMRECP